MQGETYIIDFLLIKPFLYQKLFLKKTISNVYPSVKKLKGGTKKKK